MLIFIRGFVIYEPYLIEESFESEAVGLPNLEIYEEDVIFQKGTRNFSNTTVFLKNVIMEEGFQLL